MIHRFALALFAFLLVLGLNLGTPQVVHAQDTEASLVVDLRNLPVTGAAAVLTSSFTPARYGGFGESVAYRVQVAMVGTASTVEVDFGTDLDPLKLNAGTAITAGCLYTFVFEATTADAVNVVFGTSSTIARLTVTAIRGGVM